MNRRIAIAAAITSAVVAVASAPAFGSHIWGPVGGSYHWARTSAPFTVTLSPTWSDAAWGGLLNGNSGCTGTTALPAAVTGPNTINVASNWSFSSVPTVFSGTSCVPWTDITPWARTADSPLRMGLAPTIVNVNMAKRCSAVNGIVIVCDAAYGKNGWLGLASIWLSGPHITAGSAKMNDSYMAPGMARGTSAWRTSVMCQEIGHTFGLGHQDTSGRDLDTCMDYSTTPNLYPDQHDYNILGDTIYNHVDSNTTLASGASGGAAAGAPPARGGTLRRVGSGDNFWVADMGNGVRRHVHVRWVDESVDHGPPHEG